MYILFFLLIFHEDVTVLFDFLGDTEDGIGDDDDGDVLVVILDDLRSWLPNFLYISKGSPVLVISGIVKVKLNIFDNAILKIF